MPLFTLFGQDALQFRLSDSGARGIVTDLAGAAEAARIPPSAAQPGTDLRYRRSFEAAESFQRHCGKASDSFTPVDTGPDDPALLVYTSGTTGNPKGALHGHRVLLGHLPGVELPQDFFPQPGDRFWTPADWAWVGGLLDVLLPAWHHGVSVVAHRARKFDPHEAVDLMARHQIRNTFLPPTALKLMRMADVRPAEAGSAQHRQRRRNPGRRTAGLGDRDIRRHAKRVLRPDRVQPCRQQQCLPVPDPARIAGPSGPGPFGCDRGRGRATVPTGQVGIIAVRRPDPVMFLGYWNNPAATEAKYAGDFLLTGDLARWDDDGYLWFAGRSDDLITSAGYRIGPGEIEDCLIRHPAVSMAAVAGIPDPVRTEAVKAWIVLRAGLDGSPELAAEIQEFVKNRLAAHEYPRHVEFVVELPMTATGKIIRKALRERG